VVRTKQVTPVAPSTVTPAKATRKRGSRATRPASTALDARFRGHDENMRGYQALEACH
jgi:hypothetical protein